MRMACISTLAVLAFAASASAADKGDMRPREGTLKVGDEAPAFALKSPDGKTTFTLAEHKDKKPVVIVFGSYT